MESDLGRKWMQSCGLLAVFSFVAVTLAGAQARFDADAVRLNNRGVALMGQQFTEKAEQSFAEAFKKEPKLAQAAINETREISYNLRPFQLDRLGLTKTIESMVHHC